jgi:putative YhdH/YhfP family quinone oxidoreductase
MMTKKFKAFRVDVDDNGNYKHEFVQRNIDDLPAGDVLIRVKYSSVNYKDALSAIGNKGVTRNYPHTPGIDAAGIVEHSDDDRLSQGDQVIVTGYDLGMNTDGGFSEYIRVPGDWPVKLPQGLSLKESMVYGTVGFTAALSVKKLVDNLSRKKYNRILVTGATGGVGSTAIMLLNKLGFDVVAATGKLEKKDLLLSLGATEVIHRDQIDDTSGQLLKSAEFDGVIDTVGGNTLATALQMVNYDGVVTCCGNVRGDTFESSIYPFILRGTHLIGIYSAQCPRDLRLEIWEKLANQWKIEFNENRINRITFEQLIDTINDLLAGHHSGRSILKI